MTSNNKHKLAAGLATLLLGTSAASAKPYVDKLLIHNGYNAGATNRVNGRERALDQVYPGAEQSFAVQTSDNRLVVISMSSYTDVLDVNGQTLNAVTINGQTVNTRMQALCTAVEITAEGPAIVAGPVHITNQRGDQYRNANHMAGAALASGDVLIVRNYADNTNNDAEREAAVVNSNCEIISDGPAGNGGFKQVFGNLEATGNANNNDNFCETDGQNALALVSSDANKSVFVEGCGGNGNGADDSWVYSAIATRNPTTGRYTVAYASHARLTPREERSRPSTVIMKDLSTATDAFMVNSYTDGNAQPPREGVWVMGSKVNKTTGKITPAFNQLVEEYDDIEPGVLSTQIRMTPVSLGSNDRSLASGNTLYTTWQRVDAARRRGKGKAALMGATLKITETGAQMMNVPESQLYADGDATHMAMATVNFGTVGAAQAKAFLISSSVNGSQSSLSTAKSMSFDSANATLRTERKFNLGTAMDNAWLSNIYGNNPNTQGRNFVNVGTAKNPFYGQAVGYQTDVEEFVVLAANTRRNDPATNMPEDKLALEVVLVPTVTAPGADQLGVPEPGFEQKGSGDLEGGCQVNGSAGFSSLLLLGLALLGIRRRRA